MPPGFDLSNYGNVDAARILKDLGADYNFAPQGPRAIPQGNPGMQMPGMRPPVNGAPGQAGRAGMNPAAMMALLRAMMPVGGLVGSSLMQGGSDSPDVMRWNEMQRMKQAGGPAGRQMGMPMMSGNRMATEMRR